MKKKTNKIFSCFWLISGVIWTVAGVRHFLIKDDFVGVIIYASAAAISFLLSFVYYKNIIN